MEKNYFFSDKPFKGKTFQEVREFVDSNNEIIKKVWDAKSTGITSKEFENHKEFAVYLKLNNEPSKVKANRMDMGYGGFRVVYDWDKKEQPKNTKPCSR